MSKGYFLSGLWLVDFLLWVWYPLGRKYRLSSKERPRKQRGQGVNYTYGESPLRVLELINTHCSPKSGTVFMELGCGTGRLSFAAAMQYQMKALGVDAIPSFIRRAQRICRLLGRDDVHFVKGDLFDLDWSTADMLYITTTTFTEETLSRFHLKASEVKEGGWLISLTHPPKGEGWSLMNTVVVDCSWGVATLFMSQKSTGTTP